MDKRLGGSQEPVLTWQREKYIAVCQESKYGYPPHGLITVLT